MITDTFLKNLSIGAISVAVGLTLLYNYLSVEETPAEKSSL